MINLRERWPLYCSDLEFSQQWLRDRLRHLESPSRDLHDALSLGLISEVQEIIHQSGQVLDPQLTRQILFRLALILGSEKNPYHILLGREGVLNAYLKWNQSIKDGVISICLNGGIGDHIQQLQTLRDLLGHIENVNIYLSKNRFKQLESILPRDFNCFESKSNVELMHPFQVYAATTEQVGYRSFLGCDLQNGSYGVIEFLCCWQAQGDGDPYSAFNRSVGFGHVFKFYSHLIHLGIQPDRILDITNWKQTECQSLDVIGVSRFNPASQTVGYLVDLALSSKRVISIDTALAHLCAATNRSCVVLLPFFSDERWTQLVGNASIVSSYSDNCRIIQQSAYGDWTETMKRLTQDLL